MGKPNYQFNKRQRELKKSKKQDEKRQKKLAQKARDVEETTDGDQPVTADESVTEKPEQEPNG